MDPRRGGHAAELNGPAERRKKSCAPRSSQEAEQVGLFASLFVLRIQKPVLIKEVLQRATETHSSHMIANTGTSVVEMVACCAAICAAGKLLAAPAAVRSSSVQSCE